MTKTPLNKIMLKVVAKNEDTGVTRSYGREEYWVLGKNLAHWRSDILRLRYSNPNGAGEEAIHRSVEQNKGVRT